MWIRRLAPVLAGVILLQNCSLVGGQDSSSPPPIIGGESGIVEEESSLVIDKKLTEGAEIPAQIVEVEEVEDPLDAPSFPDPGETRYVVKSQDSVLLESLIRATGAEVQVVFEVGSTRYFVVSESVATKLRASNELPGLQIAEATRLTRDRLSYEATEQTNAPWNLDILDGTSDRRLDGRYSYVSDGRGVLVYVVDSGVNLSDGTLVTKGFTPFGLETDDCDGHGTHVAATIAGPKHGVAKGATIVPVKVFWNELSSCEGTEDYYLALALDWISKNHPRDRKGVINMSLGGPVRSSSFLLEDIIEYLKSAGFVVVAAAGNDTVDACSVTPARVASLAVGASDQSDSRAYFSNYGRCVDVFAPGVEIVSRSLSGGEVALSGTSMAAPHVAGLAARLFSSGVADPASEILRRSLRIVRDSGQSAAGNMVSLSDVERPEAPRTVVGSWNGSQVVLEWSAVTGAARYRVEGRGSTSSSWTVLSTGATSTRYQVSVNRGQSATRFEFRVAAENGAGLGDYASTSVDVPGIAASTTVAPTTTTSSSTPSTTTTVVSEGSTTSTSNTVTTRPVAPRTLVGSWNGSQVVLEWSAVTGAARYRVEGRGSTSSSWTVLSTGATSTRYQVSVNRGQSATRFEFRVAAENGAGLGDYASTSVDVPGLAASTTLASTTTTTTTTVAVSAAAELVSESFSVSSITLRGTQASDNAVWWTVRVKDPMGRLSTSVGGQLCPPGSTYPFGTWCTGATFGRSGTSTDATYQGLFWISPDAPGGDWIPRFDPISGGTTVTGKARVRVTARSTSTTSAPTSSTVAKSTTTSTTTTSTTTTSTTTTSTTTTTVAAGALTLDSDTLSKSSMLLQSSINSNSIYWTVRVRDPFGGRLTNSQVGSRLCPVSSSWPDGAGCTGATAVGSGNNFDRTYTFLFLISPDAPTGQWLPRMFGPVSGQPDIVGNARVSVSVNPTTTTTSTTTTTTSTTAPAAVLIVSNRFYDGSGSTVTSVSRATSMAWVYYEVRLRDAAGRLPQTFGGQLCPLSATYPDFNRCTGATFGRSGTAFEATYTGLLGIGTGAELGTWKMTFDAINRIETSLRLTVN